MPGEAKLGLGQREVPEVPRVIPEQPHRNYVVQGHNHQNAYAINGNGMLADIPYAYNPEPWPAPPPDGYEGVRAIGRAAAARREAAVMQAWVEMAAPRPVAPAAPPAAQPAEWINVVPVFGEVHAIDPWTETVRYHMEEHSRVRWVKCLGTTRDTIDEAILIRETSMAQHPNTRYRIVKVTTRKLVEVQ